MTARSKGNSWFADFMMKGTRIREFGFPTQHAAEAWEHEARAALLRGKPLPPGPSLTARSVGAAGVGTINGLVDHVKKLRWDGMKSGETQAKVARLFAMWTGPLTPVADALEVTNIHDYVEHLQDERGCSGSTINRRLSGVSRLCKTALSLKLIPSLPELPWQQEGQGRVRWFTDDEERQILLTLRLWAQETERDFVIFLIDTGCRRGEGLRVDWSCFSAGDRTVTFWDTKNGEHRSVPLTQRAREAISRRRAVAAAQRGPFTEINGSTLRSLWDRLRTHLPFLRDAVLHTCRHTCASRLVQRGVDITRVKVWMGHKTISTTLRYAHLAPTHLDDALRMLEGGETG